MILNLMDLKARIISPAKTVKEYADRNNRIELYSFFFVLYKERLNPDPFSRATWFIWE